MSPPVFPPALTAAKSGSIPSGGNYYINENNNNYYNTIGCICCRGGPIREADRAAAHARERESAATSLVSARQAVLDQVY